MSGTERSELRHTRRAADRAEARADRAANHGDYAAVRIASAQRDALLLQRAAYKPKPK
jgi:hypothetical protein